MPRSYARVIVLVCVVVALATGCSTGGSSKASPTTNATTTTTPTGASPAPTTVAPTTAPTSASSSITTSTAAPPAHTQGCTSGPSRPPTGAHRKSIEDVDGDGRRDTVWVSAPAGTTTFGISTAAGGGASIQYPSASPVERAALVVNADERGPVEIILTDGRGANLYAFSACAIRPVLNLQGRDYAFDLGDRIGTGSGIGCVQTATGRRLVGLNEMPNADGSTVRWSRTVIELNGLTARNGPTSRGTFRAPADQARIDLLGQITCGNLTMSRDGVSDQSG